MHIQTHLGYGLDSARERLSDILVEQQREAQSTILHPCLPKGSTTVHAGSALEGVGDWSHCLELQRGLFDAQSGPLPLDSAASLTFFGFSYLYDRVAAIGLLDGHSVLFGNQSVTRRSIERGGASLCALDHTALASRFAAHPEGDKAHLFCGDVAYISALLASLGFRESTELTVANKLGDIEIVWTLGAMLAKSAELTAEDAHQGADSTCTT